MKRFVLWTLWGVLVGGVIGYFGILLPALLSAANTLAVITAAVSLLPVTLGFVMAGNRLLSEFSKEDDKKFSEGLVDDSTTNNKE